MVNQHANRLGQRLFHSQLTTPGSTWNHWLRWIQTTLNLCQEGIWVKMPQRPKILTSHADTWNAQLYDIGASIFF